MLNKLKTALAVVLGLALLSSHAARAQDAPAEPSSPEAKQIETLEGKIRARPDLMAAIAALVDDPEFQKVFEDPDVAAALSSGNTEALLSNPKINDLATHPKVQELTEKLTQ